MCVAVGLSAPAGQRYSINCRRRPAAAAHQAALAFDQRVAPSWPRQGKALFPKPSTESETGPTILAETPTMSQLHPHHRMQIPGHGAHLMRPAASKRYSYHGPPKNKSVNIKTDEFDDAAMAASFAQFWYVYSLWIYNRANAFSFLQHVLRAANNDALHFHSLLLRKVRQLSIQPKLTSPH